MLLLKLRLTIQNRILKILYISFFYPPFNTIGGMRSHGQVQALLSAGCDVRVVSAIDQGFETNNDFQSKQDHIIYYKKSLMDLSRVGTKNLNSSRRYFAIFKSFLIRWMPKFLFRTFLIFSNFLKRYEEFPGWQDTVFLEYKEDLNEWKPDIVFSSYSPIDSHIAASKISFELNTPWIAEYRDCWSFNTMGFSQSKNDLLSKYLRLQEKKILENCNLIVAATPYIQDYYKDFFRKKVELLLGGWEGQEQDNSSIKINNNQLTILHLGSMLHGTRSITPMITLMEKFPDIAKDFKFSFVGRDSKLFQDQVNKSIAKESFTLSNQVSYREAEKIGFSADILLILMQDNPMSKYTLTGKIFEYIKFHKPIICFDPYDSEASSMIIKYNMGHVVRSLEEFSDLLKSKKTINQFSRISSEDRFQFSRESQIANLLKFMKTTIRDFSNH